MESVNIEDLKEYKDYFNVTKKEKYSTIEELIKWINEAPIEEVTKLLEKHGFNFD